MSGLRALGEFAIAAARVSKVAGAETVFDCHSSE
jgi:hypothetical protein